MPALRRADHQATLLPDGRVLLVGGLNAVETLTQAESFQGAR